MNRVTKDEGRKTKDERRSRCLSSYIFRGVFLVLGMLFLIGQGLAEIFWKEEKGDHFIVYYVNARVNPKEMLWKAEGYYNRIAHELGYARYENFWQWDKRVKIYVHPDKESFHKATGQPAWSDGMASYLEKSIHTIENTKSFTESVLPHEIAHLIFRDFVGFKGQIPLWLDEGVAQWQEDDKREEALKAIPNIILMGYALPLSKLTRTDIRRETDPKKVSAFYLQAVSLVDFLIKSHGTNSFTEFCRALRDGKDIEAALRSAYSQSIASIDQLEEKWVKYVMKKEGEKE